MSNLEHYFENLLFNGQDLKGDWNKNALTEAEQKAVEICADYVLYSLFLNRDDFLKFVNGKDINVITNADRIRAMTDEELAELFASPCPNGLEPEDSCFYAISDGDDTVCKNCWLEWLKQEED